MVSNQKLILTSLIKGAKFSSRIDHIGKTKGPEKATPLSKSNELDFFGFDEPQPEESSMKQAKEGTLIKAERKGSVPSLPAVDKETETMDAESDDTSTSEVDEGDDDDDDDDDDDAEKHMAMFKTSKSSKSKKVQKTVQTAAQRKAEEVAVFRKAMHIRVTGDVIPHPIASFDEMDISNHRMKNVLLQNIEKSQYKEPTAVQMQAIPAVLSKRDTLAIAPTGSGKTAAFVLPILGLLATPRNAQLKKNDTNEIRAVVLAPTKELAQQIHMEFLRLSHGRKIRMCLLSKATAANVANEFKTKQAVYDILISTPLRLVHLIQSEAIDLSQVSILCLDEADQLLDAKFVEQLDQILAQCTHKEIQRVMFSATMLEGLEDLAQSVLREPIRVFIGTKNACAKTIDQQLMFVGREEGKILAIRQLIQEGRLCPPTLLFVQNRARVQELYQELLFDGIQVGAIDSDKSARHREDTIRDFRLGRVWVLICTDLMSRGMDFKGVQLVINYDFPQTAVSYIHRIGRTGRAGRRGRAITFFTEHDMQYLRSIANVMQLSGCHVPAWMLSLKKPSKNMKQELVERPPRRPRISTLSKQDQEAQEMKRRRRQHRLLTST